MIYSIDVSGNDRHIVLFYKKCHLLPFAKVGQYYQYIIIIFLNPYTIHTLALLSHMVEKKYSDIKVLVQKVFKKNENISSLQLRFFHPQLSKLMGG